jgi:hypothetical protein
MMELVKAVQKKWGGDAGTVLYFDLSGHVFVDDIGESGGEAVFSFDNFEKLTVEDIENAPMTFSNDIDDELEEI